MGHNPFLEPARRASPRSGARAARSIAASVALLLVFVFASPHEAAAQGKGHGHPA